VAWDPQTYLKYSGERARPAADLLARVPVVAPRVAVDLGCGAGNITRLLAERWPAATIVGVDGSEAMLASARAAGIRARFERADIADFRPDVAPDVIYSNAALHWLGDHAALFPRLVRVLAPGGALAVQMPRNHHRPLQSILSAMVDEWGLAPRLVGVAGRSEILAPEAYYAVLMPHVAALDIWEVDYLHVLAGDNPAFEWAKGTSLRPVLAVLDAADQGRFLDTYAARTKDAYPRDGQGRTLFPFRRTFIVATARG